MTFWGRLTGSPGSPFSPRSPCLPCFPCQIKFFVIWTNGRYVAKWLVFFTIKKKRKQIKEFKNWRGKWWAENWPELRLSRGFRPPLSRPLVPINKQTRMRKSWHTFDLCLIQRNAHYSSTHHFPVSSGDSGRSWHSINSLQIRRVSTMRYSSHIEYLNFVCKNLFKVYVKFGLCNSLVSHRFRTALVLPALQTPPKTRGHN